MPFVRATYCATRVRLGGLVGGIRELRGELRGELVDVGAEHRHELARQEQRGDLFEVLGRRRRDRGRVQADLVVEDRGVQPLELQARRAAELVDEPAAGFW